MLITSLTDDNWFESLAADKFYNYDRKYKHNTI